MQLTTDHHKVWLQAEGRTFGGCIGYTVLLSEGPQSPERKCTPVEFLSAEKKRITGNPDKAHVSTSDVERRNLTMRVSMRRFNRMTNGFSKNPEYRVHAAVLHFI